MRGNFRTLMGAFVVSTALFSGAGQAAAAPPDGPHSKANTAVGVNATYDGKSRNLMKDGWGGASICAEFAVGDVRCFDSASAFNASATSAGLTTLTTQPSSSAGLAADDGTGCGATWVCLYEHADFNKYTTGRRLMFQSSGEKNLYDYSFADKTSSAANMRSAGQGGVTLCDSVFGPDRQLLLGVGTWMRYVGSSWNDKIDYFKV